MKDKSRKADSKKDQTENTSKKSFESDPILKDLYSVISDKHSSLREELSREGMDLEKLFPSYKDVTSLVNKIGDVPELKIDFKQSLAKIARTFTNALASTKAQEKVNYQIRELLVENFFLTARALAIAVEARDPYTGGHSDRVFQISAELGKRCNVSPVEQLYLEGGSLLHDVGKIAIRDGVLLKPGPLTDMEYKEMQLHTIFGAQIVKKLNCLHGCVDAVLFHHERIDGYGYPYGLKGDEIPLTARITSIADAYDAMTTNRIYRKALTHEQALEEVIRNSGTQFDSEIVKIFVKWWEENFGSNLTKKKEFNSAGV